MATITKSADAPSGNASLSVGQTTFTLTDASPTYTTDDPVILQAARASSEFKVEEDVAAEVVAADGTPGDPNDPRLNPRADHLSAQASPEAIAAAEENRLAIQNVVGTGNQQVNDGVQPTIAEQQNALFDTLGVQVEPVLPYTAPDPQDHAPVATPESETVAAVQSAGTSEPAATPSTSSEDKPTTTSTGASS